MKLQQASLDSSCSVYQVRRPNPHRQLFFIIAVLWGQIPFGSQCLAETLTVPEMLSKGLALRRTRKRKVRRRCQ